jgi:hypothetical protein
MVKICLNILKKLRNLAVPLKVIIKILPNCFSIISINLLKIGNELVNWVVKSLRRYGPINFFFTKNGKKKSVVHSVGREYTRRARAWVAILVVLGLLEAFLEIMETSQSRVEAPHEINNNSESNVEVLKEKRKISTFGDPFRQRLVLARMERERLLDPYHAEAVRKVQRKVPVYRDVAGLSETQHKIREAREAREASATRFKEQRAVRKWEMEERKNLLEKQASRLGAIQKSYDDLMENRIKGEVPTKRSSLFVELWNKIKNSWGMLFDIKGEGEKVFPTFKDIGAIRPMEFYTRSERKLLKSREIRLGEVLSGSYAAWQGLEERFKIMRPRLAEEREFISGFISFSEIHKEKAQEILKSEMLLKYREVVCVLDTLYAKEDLINAVTVPFGAARLQEQDYDGIRKAREAAAIAKAPVLIQYGVDCLHLSILWKAMRALNIVRGGFREDMEKKMTTAIVDFRVLTICQNSLAIRFGETGIIKFNVKDD